MSEKNQVLYFDEDVSNLIIHEIKDAKREIVLVSPYFKPWNHLGRVLREAGARNVRRQLYYRSDARDFDPNAVTQLFDQQTPIEFLHAKIYLIDDVVLISSMNLLEFSHQSSREFAMRIVDPGQRQQLREYVHSLGSTLMPVNSQTATSKAATSSASKLPAQAYKEMVSVMRERGYSDGGYCIRCGESISWDPERPFCRPCYSEWRIYENELYVEKVCHSCGKANRTSMERPECRPCYRANS